MNDESAPAEKTDGNNSPQPPQEQNEPAPEPKAPTEEGRGQPAGPRVILDQLDKEPEAAPSSPEQAPSADTPATPAAEPVKETPAAQAQPDGETQSLISESMKRLDALLEKIKQERAGNPGS